MQQQISVIALGIADLARSKRFYVEGFGWQPVLETPDIVFYKMNGLMLDTWLASAFEDTRRVGLKLQNWPCKTGRTFLPGRLVAGSGACSTAR